VGIAIEKTNAGIGIPASVISVRYRAKKMPDCAALFRYRTISGIVRFLQSGTGLSRCRTIRYSGSHFYLFWKFSKNTFSQTSFQFLRFSRIFARRRKSYQIFRELFLKTAYFWIPVVSLTFFARKKTSLPNISWHFRKKRRIFRIVSLTFFARKKRFSNIPNWKNCV
jgi:hypothetical protein